MLATFIKVIWSKFILMGHRCDLKGRHSLLTLLDSRQTKRSDEEDGLLWKSSSPIDLASLSCLKCLWNWLYIFLKNFPIWSSFHLEWTYNILDFKPIDIHSLLFAVSGSSSHKQMGLTLRKINSGYFVLNDGHCGLFQLYFIWNPDPELLCMFSFLFFFLDLWGRPWNHNDNRLWMSRNQAKNRSK